MRPSFRREQWAMPPSSAVETLLIWGLPSMKASGM